MVPRGGHHLKCYSLESGGDPFDYDVEEYQLSSSKVENKVPQGGITSVEESFEFWFPRIT